MGGFTHQVYVCMCGRRRKRRIVPSVCMAQYRAHSIGEVPAPKSLQSGFPQRETTETEKLAKVQGGNDQNRKGLLEEVS